MVETSSYGATSLSTRSTWTRASEPLLSTRPPSVSSSFTIVRTSLSAGTFGKTSGSAVKRLAASAGSAAFLAALTATDPFNGRPPSISNLAGMSHLAGRRALHIPSPAGRGRGGGRRQAAHPTPVRFTHRPSPSTGRATTSHEAGHAG